MGCVDHETLGAGVVEDSVHQGLGGYQDVDEVSLALTAVIVSFSNCVGQYVGRVRRVWFQRVNFNPLLQLINVKLFARLTALQNCILTKSLFDSV